MSKHANISVFVPHLGCPNDCSFCNQRHITGSSTEPSATDVENAVMVAASSPKFTPSETEIAFFGGSFTAIERDYMLLLLKAADKLVRTYCLRGIRVSTRPDCINEEVLEILKAHSVTAIELGAQSLDDDVLSLNDRGHTAEDVDNASSLIRKFGFELGLQMMTGLYGDTEEKALYTAREIVRLKPDTVRIYPTIVLKGTRLARLYNEGKYIPQQLDNAVELCVKIQSIFSDANIRIIRTGLHSIDPDSYVAGPWHPAFSELCESKKIFNKIVSECHKGKAYEILIHPSDVSKAYGQKRENIEKLMNEGLNVKFIQSKDVNKNTMLIREVNQG